MSFQALKQELDIGKTRNLYIFTGDEREVMRKYIKRISQNPIKASSFKAVVNQMSTRGLFAQNQTYLIEDDKDILDMDLTQVLKIVRTNILILTFKTVDQRMKFFKAASVMNLIVDFQKFTDVQLISFVQKQVSVNENDAMLLSRYCGNDVARIELEADKLYYLSLEGYELTPDLIKQVVTPPLEDRIFDMIDAVAKREKQKAYALYADLIELKESPIKIVSLLYTKFKQVFLVQFYSKEANAELCGKTGLNFYQVNMTRQLVGRFSTDRLLAIMKMIQSAEVKMKTGELDIDMGMDILMLNILA